MLPYDYKALWPHVSGPPTWRSYPQPVDVHDGLLQVDLDLLVFALVPEAEQSFLHREHVGMLSGSHLRFRPVDLVNCLKKVKVSSYEVKFCLELLWLRAASGHFLDLTSLVAVFVLII